MRHAYDNRTDSNQAEIVRSLKRIPGLGVVVLDNLGAGFGDILVWWKQYHLIEIKTSTGKLNKKQVERSETWPGPMPVARSLDEVLKIIGLANPGL